MIIIWIVYFLTIYQHKPDDLDNLFFLINMDTEYQCISFPLILFMIHIAAKNVDE